MTDTRNSEPRQWVLQITEPDGQTQHTVKVDERAPHMATDLIDLVAQIGAMFVGLLGAHDRSIIEGVAGVAPATQPEVPHRA